MMDIKEIVDHVGGITQFEQNMLAEIESFGASRELDLAKTKIEEAVAWMIKHFAIEHNKLATAQMQSSNDDIPTADAPSAE